MPKILALPQSIVIGGAVFAAACNSHDVLRYETRSDKWSVLSSCSVRSFGLGRNIFRSYQTIPAAYRNRDATIDLHKTIAMTLT